MVVEFDPEKSARNVAERGLSFDRVDEFDWPNVLVLEDKRRDYGELRLQVYGFLDGRLHIAVVTPREKDLRVISLRRASRKEERTYEENIGRGSRAP